jgi:hypothetical protein
VLNLPGRPKAIRETLDEVFQSVPYCIQLAGGPYLETHDAVVKAFRPPADRRTAPVPAPSPTPAPGPAAIDEQRTAKRD